MPMACVTNVCNSWLFFCQIKRVSMISRSLPCQPHNSNQILYPIIFHLLFLTGPWNIEDTNVTPVQCQCGTLYSDQSVPSILNIKFTCHRPVMCINDRHSCYDITAMWQMLDILCLGQMTEFVILSLKWSKCGKMGFSLLREVISLL